MTTVTEVKKILMNSKTTTCHLDHIPTSLLKILIDVPLPVLTHIINMSFEDGSIPHDLKMSLIIPLLNKLSLNPEIIKHFQSISNLPYLSTLIEREWQPKRLLDHIFLNHLVHDIFQSAYN